MFRGNGLKTLDHPFFTKKNPDVQHADNIDKELAKILLTAVRLRFLTKLFGHPIFISLFLTLTLASIAIAQEAPLTKLRFSYSAITGSNYGTLVALDEGLFRRNGLDVEAVLIQSTAFTTTALLSGQVQVVFANAVGALSAYKSGAKDMVILATTSEKFLFSLFARPHIKTAKELAGTRIGITRRGGSLDNAVRFALLQAGLDPERDNIVFLQGGTQVDRLNALSKGVIDATVFQGVFKLRAVQLGFRELIDLSETDIKFPQNSIVTTKQFLRDHRALAVRFVKSYMEGTKLYLQSPQVAKKIVSRYTGVKDAAILDTDYRDWARVLLRQPMTEFDPIAMAMQSIGITDKREQREIYHAVVDNSIVKSMTTNM